jgi:hypothetical protein
MYAPTWRDDEAIREGSYQFNVNFDIEALRQAFLSNGIFNLVLIPLIYSVSLRLCDNLSFLG